MRNKTSLAIILAPILLFAWILISRIPPSGLLSSAIEAPKENFLAPDFSLAALNGSEISLSDLQGKPVILNFWASWCPPCRAEMPAFQEAWLEYGDTDLMIIGVNSTRQDTLPGILNFLDSIPIGFPILLDEAGSVTSDYQVHSLPTTYFINRSGVIEKIVIGGPLPLSLLRIQADQLLEE